MSNPVTSNVMDRYSQSLRVAELLLLFDWLPLSLFREGRRPTMKGFGAGFFGLDVGSVFMLFFKSSLDEPWSTR